MPTVFLSAEDMGCAGSLRAAFFIRICRVVNKRQRPLWRQIKQTERGKKSGRERLGAGSSAPWSPYSES